MDHACTFSTPRSEWSTQVGRQAGRQRQATSKLATSARLFLLLIAHFLTAHAKLLWHIVIVGGLSFEFRNSLPLALILIALNCNAALS